MEFSPSGDWDHLDQQHINKRLARNNLKINEYNKINIDLRESEALAAHVFSISRMNTFSRNVQVKCINHHLQKLSTDHMIHKNQKLLKKRIFSWSVVVYHGQQRTSQAIAKEQAISQSVQQPQLLN